MRWQFKLHTTGEAPFDIPPKEEPIGWGSAEFVIRRDDKWHGAFFDYTAQLTFICGAGDYIRAAYAKYGVDAQVKITILHSCAEGLPFTTVYEGRLAMVTMKEEFKTGGVSVNLEAQNDLMTLVNRRDVKVDLLKDVTFSGAGYNPYLPYARIDNETGLPVVSSVIGKFDENSNPPIIPALGSPVVGIVATTVEMNASDANSCADPQHYLTWYYHFQWETLLDETQGAWLNPNNIQDNYDASECDNINLNAPPHRPPVAIRANKTASYRIKYCFCVDYLLFVQTILDLVSTNRPNDFDYWEIAVYGQKNNDPIFLMTPVTTVIKNGVLPGGPGPDLVGCGGFTQPSQTDDLFYTQGTACLEIDEVVDLVIGDEFRFSVLFRCCGTWDSDTFTTECVFGLINACFHDVCCLEITETSFVTYPDSFITGYLANEAFGRIVQNITDNAMTVKSGFFGRLDSRPFNTLSPNCDANVFLTNGFQVRGFPSGRYSVPVVDTNCYSQSDYFERGWFLSLNELFDTLNAIFNLGIGFIDTLNGRALIVEAKEYFYANYTTIDLGDLDAFNIGLEITYDTRWTFNRVVGGYNNWAAQTVNGLSEINARRSWTTRLSSVKNELSIASDFIASGYTLEVTRRENFIDTGNADTDFDDNTFVIFCESETFENAGLNYLAVPQKGVDIPLANVLSPTQTLNFHLSPSANLRRWINFAATGLEPQIAGTAFTFEAGEANYQATATDKVHCNIMETRTENAPVGIKEGRGKPFLSPRVVKFSFELTFAQYNKIKDNSYGLVKFTVNGRKIEGWLLNLQFKPDDISEFELILKKQ